MFVWICTGVIIDIFIIPQELKNERDGNKHVVHASAVERFVSQAYTQRVYVACTKIM